MKKIVKKILKSKKSHLCYTPKFVSKDDYNFLLNLTVTCSHAEKNEILEVSYSECKRLSKIIDKIIADKHF